MPQNAKGLPIVIVIAGVSGSGKTSVGEALAKRLAWTFKEGDELHPQANIKKMTAGRPLTDADRVPWLDAVAAWMAARVAAGENGIISCSALKRSYRDRLRLADPSLRLVMLEPDRETLRRRVEGRVHHFMPAALLDSQLASLECPGPNEKALVLPGTDGVALTVERIVEWLSPRPAPDAMA